MDIYSYINSKAISDYLRSINYKFDTKEAAWLIFQCKTISLEERHKAWKKLIEEFPDCTLEERMNCRKRDSLFKLIEDYIRIINEHYKLFEQQENEAIYQYRYYIKGDNYGWSEDYESVFKTLEECWQKIYNDEEPGIETIQIRKRYIGSNKIITVTYRLDKTVLEIETNKLSDEEYEVIYESFDGLWFDFPVPFQKGDILIENRIPEPRDSYGESGPFVMDGITPWEIERNKARKEKGYGDNSDMSAWGYFQDEDGRIFHESMFNYMNLDYYEGPFEGTKRLLVALSNYIKDEISLDLLLTTYRKVILDEVTDDIMLRHWYTDEGLKLAGLKRD